MAERPASQKCEKAGGASPFLVLKQPKLELDVPLPTDPQPQAKPRFEPKLKPRPGAKARPPKPQHAPKDQSTDDPLVGRPAKRASPSKDAESQGTHLSPPKLGQDVKTDVAKAMQEDFDSKLKVKSEVGAPFVAASQEGAVKAEKLEPKSEVDLQSEVGLGDEMIGGEREDRVVKEIDVYLSTIADTETKLYLLQYPLRPSWRPYGLEERCQEVRLKPKFTKLEVDLNIDADNENYDHDAAEHLQITKQVSSAIFEGDTSKYSQLDAFPLCKLDLGLL